MHTAVQSSERAAEGPERGRRGRATRVAVAGATGYTGQELLRLLSRHPGVTIAAAMSSGARPAAPGTPATPRLAPALVEADIRVIDLSGAFRLRDRAMRARWYPETHELPEGLAYGLTELERTAIEAARLVANPGCYPTATILPLAPLAAAGLLAPDTDIIVDAKSGVSGAGKTPSERTHFSEVHGSVSAYGVFGHRHGAEIEQGASRQITFVPHLMPLDRGILSTMYVRVAPGTTEDVIGSVYERTYGGEPFIRVTSSALPEIKHVA